MKNPPDQPSELPTGPSLSDADMRVLDFLAEHGFDASRIELLPEADRPRAMALIGQMQVLDHYPTESAEDSLVDATMDRRGFAGVGPSSSTLCRHFPGPSRLHGRTSWCTLWWSRLGPWHRRTGRRYSRRWVHAPLVAHRW